MAWRMTTGGRIDAVDGQLDMLDETGRLRTAPVTVASLCSGYGGLEMAIELWLGEVDVRWFAEKDPSASTVLSRRHPDVPNLGDFTRPGFWSDAEYCEWIVGGIPCQPYSFTGRHLGTDDPRYLWPSMREGIKRNLPDTVVFENVEALTQGRMRTIFNGVVGDLLDFGYDVRWTVFGACAIGAAHHRHRVFLLARRAVGDPSARRVDAGPCSHENLIPTPRGRDGVGGPGHGVKKQGGDSLATVASRELGLSPSDRWGRYAEAVAHHEDVLGRPAPEPAEIGPRGGRRLTAAFSEWLMMLPEGHLTSILDRNAALTRAGNGVVPLQAATALRLLAADLDAP